MTPIRKVCIVAFCLVLLGAGWFGGSKFEQRQRENIQPLRTISKDLHFVEPLLAVGNLELLRDFDPLQRVLERKAREYQQSGKAERLSVYYRDLESGRWTGVNENEKYAPASMYKVALLITLLKAAETNHTLLNTRLLFSGGLSTLEEREPTPYLKVGQSYSVVELLEDLIVHSDNDAKNLLHTIVPRESRMEVFTDLGLVPPVAGDTGDSLSAKSYSIFFRVLFNGTYLSPTFSESALELLSRPEFTKGLVAGLPDDIKSAHKFGRRVFLATSAAAAREELHDCGNVYLPGHPYFLCVMTDGKDDATLASIIAEISKTVFEYTEKEYQ